MPTTTRGADTVFASADWDTPWHFRVERIYGREILRPDTQVEKDANEHTTDPLHRQPSAAR